MEGHEQKDPHPNIIVPYTQADELPADGGGAYAVAYVRPETNSVLYERAIVSALRACSTTVYMANLNGSLFLKDCILEEHYSSQFRFARNPRETMRLYPPIARRFEERFGMPFTEAPLAGSLQLAGKPGFDVDTLFHTIVPEGDFLDCWGQEFKRIGDLIVVNPNLPAVMARYTPEANVMVIVVRSRGACEEAHPDAASDPADGAVRAGPGHTAPAGAAPYPKAAAPGPAEGSGDFFSHVNRAIYSGIIAGHGTPLVDGERLDSLVWSEKIRRTYHLSTGHIMAMFDMADLVYRNDRQRLPVRDTPLGRLLLSRGMTPERLAYLKEAQLAYLGNPKDGAPLAWLPAEGTGMGVQQSVEMLMHARAV